MNKIFEHWNKKIETCENFVYLAGFEVKMKELIEQLSSLKCPKKGFVQDDLGKNLDWGAEDAMAFTFDLRNAIISKILLPIESRKKELSDKYDEQEDDNEEKAIDTEKPC